jgi:hypothetical protein
MNDRDIEKVEQNLTALLARKRHEAIVFSLLTVALTPLVVAAITFIIGGLVLGVMVQTQSILIGAPALYMTFSLFLGTMVGLVLMGPRLTPQLDEIEGLWLLAAVLYILLLCLTYLTSLREQIPVVFAVLYAAAAFVILGLLGRVHLDRPLTFDSNVNAETSRALEVFAMLGAGCIVSAYAEVASASWLWLPPKRDEIHFAAWLLCTLADDPGKPIDAGRVDRRLVRLLVRFKFVEVTDNRFALSRDGRTFVETATDGDLSTLSMDP